MLINELRRPYRNSLFIRKKTLYRFPLAHHVDGGVVYHDFGGAWTAIVLTGHRKRIGTGRHNGQQVARLNTQLAIARKPVTTFTNGTDYVITAGRPRSFALAQPLH